MNLQELKRLTDTFSAGERMPLLFIGHGNPMNALANNAFTQSLTNAGKQIKEKYQPKAVLVVSAHWLTKGTFVQISPQPKVIYDFGGFPKELYEVKYPAQGSPEFARQVRQLAPDLIKETEEWGLDHGTWTVLKHLFPQADVPIFQLSIDYHRPMQYHFDLALQLKSLRDKGVLIIGSGNVVHNLPKSFDAFSRNAPEFKYDWATTFDEWIKTKLNERDYLGLINYAQAGEAGLLSVPTVDHYVPLLYNVAMADPKEPLTTHYEEVAFGAISMRTFQIG